jgi:hypothetical protein
VRQREDIIAEIAHQEQRIAKLRSEVDACEARLSNLREELVLLPPEEARTSPPATPAPQVPAPTSNAEKIALFRSLFRGREDVFALRWENPKIGKSGYSPAYTSEWKRQLFEDKSRGSLKAPVTSGERMTQVYLPVTDDAITKHLRGTHVMGIYPLLLDESCWFLAADFDKRSWQDDIGAFAATCRTNRVPVAAEGHDPATGRMPGSSSLLPCPHRRRDALVVSC